MPSGGASSQRTPKLLPTASPICALAPSAWADHVINGGLNHRAKSTQFRRSGADAVLAPARDASEVVEAWKEIMPLPHDPVALILSSHRPTRPSLRRLELRCGPS